VKRIGGSRRKTRCKLTKNVRTRGKISLKKYFQEFSSGDKVVLLTDSSCHRGMFFRRFYGTIGTVLNKCGKKRDSCYSVAIKDNGKEKKVIVHPIHLKRIEAKT
jgi:ribosomal protein L21E